MNSAAMNGTRSADSLVRAMRVVPGSMRRRAIEFRCAFQARATRELQIGETQQEIAGVALELAVDGEVIERACGVLADFELARTGLPAAEAMRPSRRCSVASSVPRPLASSMGSLCRNTRRAITRRSPDTPDPSPRPSSFADRNKDWPTSCESSMVPKALKLDAPRLTTAWLSVKVCARRMIATTQQMHARAFDFDAAVRHELGPGRETAHQRGLVFGLRGAPASCARTRACRRTGRDRGIADDLDVGRRQRDVAQ